MRLPGEPAEVAAAIRPGRLTDWVGSTVALGGLSLPHFWFGILAIQIFAVHLHVLPSGGFSPLANGLGGNLEDMIMPVVERSEPARRPAARVRLLLPVHLPRSRGRALTSALAPTEIGRG